MFTQCFSNIIKYVMLSHADESHSFLLLIAFDVQVCCNILLMLFSYSSIVVFKVV